METTTKHNTELEWKPPPSTTPSWSGKLPPTTPSYNGNHHHVFKSSYNQVQHRAAMETTTKHNTELEWKPPPSTTPSWCENSPRKTPNYNGNHHHVFKSSYNQAQHRAGVETTTKHNTELEWKITPRF